MSLNTRNQIKQAIQNIFTDYDINNKPKTYREWKHILSNHESSLKNESDIRSASDMLYKKEA